MAEYLVQNESLTAIADAIRAKTGGTEKITLDQMPEAITGIRTSGAYQEKSVTPTGEQFDVLPDDGYDAMSKVTVEGDTALKPWNIPEGTTIYGVVGTAKLSVTTDPPADLPVSKDDADAALAENDATADTSAYDLMVLAQDDGNITYCYLAKDTQNSPFVITGYDPITTEFKAKGWRRLSYHTTGEQAGTWTYDDFTDTESGGWNYLKNIRSCSREKLYYNGYEVWPNPIVSCLYNGLELPLLPLRNQETYPYALIASFENNSRRYVTLVYSSCKLEREKVALMLQLYATSSGSAIAYKFDSLYEQDGWKRYTSYDKDFSAAGEYIGMTVTDKVKWANYDVINYGDGTVYLEASEPVPVYK